MLDVTFTSISEKLCLKTVRDGYILTRIVFFNKTTDTHNTH